MPLKKSASKEENNAERLRRYHARKAAEKKFGKAALKGKTVHHSILIIHYILCIIIMSFIEWQLPGKRKGFNLWKFRKYSGNILTFIEES